MFRNTARKHRHTGFGGFVFRRDTDDVVRRDEDILAREERVRQQLREGLYRPRMWL